MQVNTKWHSSRFVAGILLACVLALTEQAGLAAGESSAATAQTCTKYMSFRTVAPEELLEQAVYKPQPQDDPLLRQADFHAIVTVGVFVDKSGRVVCAEVHQPAPGPDGGLNAVSLAAARKWRFRPLQAPSGKRVGMHGDLTFHLDH